MFFLNFKIVCNFVVHERCQKMVVSPCSTVASNMIKVSDDEQTNQTNLTQTLTPKCNTFQNPVPHCLTLYNISKRKFCMVCRKRFNEDVPAYRCEVCEYCVHMDCVDFSVPDCRECATYVPEQELVSVQLF